MSVSVKTYDFSMPPYGACQIQAGGTYFRVQSSSGPIKVQGEFGEATPLLQGQGLKDSEFSRLSLTNLSGNQNTGTIIVAGDEFVDQQMVLSGNVNTSINPILNIYGSGGDMTITSASQQILAQRMSRRYLLVQNKSTTGSVWLSIGLAAIATQGIFLPPGSIYEMSASVFAHPIYAIGDIASNPNVLVLEGY